MTTVTKHGKKKGPANQVTLPVMRQQAGQVVPDDGDQSFEDIPSQVNVPGVGWRPGINPRGSQHYNQLMAGQTPTEPFDFSAQPAPAQVNPQVAKFAAKMQKAAAMRQARGQ